VTSTTSRSSTITTLDLRNCWAPHRNSTTISAFLEFLFYVVAKFCLFHPPDATPQCRLSRSSAAEWWSLIIRHERWWIFHLSTCFRQAKRVWQPQTVAMTRPLSKMALPTWEPLARLT
jgi:hypothetical protein